MGWMVEASNFKNMVWIAEASTFKALLFDLRE
jgi:hypothetical protein